MISDINDYRPHTVQGVICLKCFHRWIAVFPTDTLLKEIECPKCGEIGYIIGTGQDLDARKDWKEK